MLTTNFMPLSILHHDQAWVTAHSDAKLICPDWRTAGQDTARWARRLYPTSTVRHPNTILPPWTVRSPSRAWGMGIVKTVEDPTAIISGGPTQVALSVTRAAGRPPMRTVTAPGGRMIPPTCGTNTVTMGQTCGSVTLAAGIPI